MGVSVAVTLISTTEDDADASADEEEELPPPIPLQPLSTTDPAITKAASFAFLYIWLFSLRFSDSIPVFLFHCPGSPLCAENLLCLTIIAFFLPNTTLFL